MMSKEKRFVQSQYVHHLRDTETDTHYYLTSEKIGCRDLFDEIEKLTEENRQLKQEHKIAIDEMLTDYKKLEEENEQLQKEKEYYREYALQYLLEYDLYTDNFLNDIKDIIGEEGVKRVKEKQNKIIEALKKEGLYE